MKILSASLSCLFIAIVALLLIILTGCMQVPEVNAKSIRYESHYPIGGSTIEMHGVEVTDTQVKADSYHRKSNWWYVSQDVEIEGYSRQREGKDKAP